MNLYAILNWSGLSLLILSIYPHLFLYHKKKDCYYSPSYMIFNLMEYFVFLLVCLLQLYFPNTESSPGLYSDLIFVIHGLLVSGLIIIIQLNSNDSFFDDVPSATQKSTIVI